MQLFDLLALEKISDPFIGTNEKDVYWVAQTDWEYKKRFTVDKALLSCDRVYLECKTLDTICTLYLNDTCIGHGENAHLAYSFDVKDNLREGENELRIIFASPVNYVKEKQAKSGARAIRTGRTVSRIFANRSAISVGTGVRFCRRAAFPATLRLSATTPQN